MTDIIERLKAMVYTPRLYQTQLDAAEEIADLRAEVLRLRASLRYERARTDLIEADLEEKTSLAAAMRAELYAMSIKNRDKGLSSPDAPRESTSAPCQSSRCRHAVSRQRPSASQD